HGEPHLFDRARLERPLTLQVMDGVRYGLAGRVAGVGLDDQVATEPLLAKPGQQALLPRPRRIGLEVAVAAFEDGRRPTKALLSQQGALEAELSRPTRVN